MNFAFLVEMMLLRSSFTVSRSAVGVPQSPGKLTRFPPIVTRVLYLSFFPSRYTLTILAYAVLDDEMGNLLEYRHLMKHPKYKDVWTKSFGTEIRRLTTTTETIFFVKKEDIPNDRKGDETYARLQRNWRGYFLDAA